MTFVVKYFTIAEMTDRLLPLASTIFLLTFSIIGEISHTLLTKCALFSQLDHNMQGKRAA
jgi:hypothetical protein